MSRAVAVASSALRRLGAVSRPMIVARTIYTTPVAVGRRPFPLFRPKPMLLFPRELSRGYTSGGGARLSDEDDDDEEEEDLSDESLNDEDLDLGSEEDMGDEPVESESE